MKNVLLILLLVLVTIPATAVEARDRSRGGNDSGRRTRIERHDSEAGSQRSRINGDEAAEIAEKQFKGRVLDVKRDDGVWRVKMLSQKGEVRVLVVDEDTGKIISPR